LGGFIRKRTVKNEEGKFMMGHKLGRKDAEQKGGQKRPAFMRDWATSTRRFKSKGGKQKKKKKRKHTNQPKKEQNQKTKKKKTKIHTTRKAKKTNHETNKKKNKRLVLIAF